MSKKLSELGVDHEYAPGMEPADPTLFERFWAYAQQLELWHLADTAFVITGLLFFFVVFSAFLAMGRLWRIREERRHAAEIEARKLARQQGIAEARRQFATSP